MLARSVSWRGMSALDDARRLPRRSRDRSFRRSAIFSTGIALSRAAASSIARGVSFSPLPILSIEMFAVIEHQQEAPRGEISAHEVHRVLRGSLRGYAQCGPDHLRQ